MLMGLEFGVDVVTAMRAVLVTLLAGLKVTAGVMLDDTGVGLVCVDSPLQADRNNPSSSTP